MVDASDGEILADPTSFAKPSTTASRRQLRRRLRRHRRPDRRSRRHDRPRNQAFLDLRRDRTGEADRGRQPDPRLRQIEIDVSSDLGSDEPPSGDATELLGSLPADSVVGVRHRRLRQADRRRDRRDRREGHPGRDPAEPVQERLKEAGIDLDKIAGSIGDLGVFVEGDSESNLGGAVVMTTTKAERSAEHGRQHRPAAARHRHPGRDRDLRRPQRLLGPQRRTSARSRWSSPPRASRSRSPTACRRRPRRLHRPQARPSATPGFKEAASALGATPISGFVGGPAALSLASALLPADEKAEFEEAKPYLDKIELPGDRRRFRRRRQATAKLIVGLGK